MRPDRKIYYYGCIGHAGHYLWENERRKLYEYKITPWGIQVDTRLCWQEKQIEGVARLHHAEGWTAVAFWDRSVDHRLGSNSVFLVNEVMSFEDVVALAKEKFPGVWKRFTFEISLRTE